MPVGQDADVYAALLDGDERVTHHVRGGRAVWVQVARGEATVNGRALAEGDGAAVRDESSVELTGTGAELLLFDLPA